MGEVFADLILASMPHPEIVCEVRAVAGTGARWSSVPESVARDLDMLPGRRMLVRLANGHTQKVPVLDGIRFEIDGRETSDEALVRGDHVLIGQTVLAKRHLMADCAGRRLVAEPQQPPYPVYRV
jgi:hypothetical protein